MAHLYLQYHNAEQQGRLPQGNWQQSSTRELQRLQIYTRSASARQASGQVMLIVGLGQPRQYYLWSTFLIDRCQQKPDGSLVLEGPGWHLCPPQRLTGTDFTSFKAACANFIGFREITQLPFARKLHLLGERHRTLGSVIDMPVTDKITCWRNMHEAAQTPSLKQQLAEYLGTLEPQPASDPAEPTIALSIRQPHVEAILRGIKKIEYRREATTRRGRILIYSAKLFAENLDHWIDEYGMKKVNLDTLPRGYVVGSVELFKCNGGEWHLRHPQRAKTLRRPTGRPQPIWFTPFE